MDCGLQVETRYARNEFSGLDDDSLHLLRIFVACEGRIRDMEAALGVSYPTVKARLAELRGALGVDENRGAKAPPGETSSGASEASREAAPDASEVIGRLERGEIDYDEAMRQLKRSPGRA